MAVTIGSQKRCEPKRTETLAKKHTKPLYKTRPITATLEHPLILDIKLLKKLDMTTFTKKGLMALSKFCGISLINKTETRKKLSKCVKTIRYSKKQLETTGGGEACEGQAGVPGKRESRSKRKLGKQVSKGKARIRFKMAKEESSPDEDSSDVICKSRSEVLKTFNRVTNSRSSGESRERKTIIESILNGTVENVIPEPCKTCSRSEHPERFHSHPKMLTRLEPQEKRSEKKLEERFRKSVTTKDPEGEAKEGGKKSPGAKETEDKSPQVSEKKAPNSSKCSSKSPTKSSSSAELSSPETAGKINSKSPRSPFTSSLSGTKSKNGTKKTIARRTASQSEQNPTTDEEGMKFVTGCYVCGKELSPKSRMKHEKSCIVEWRAQNVIVPGERRKVEPKRPDFRFTASGDLDCEGTFESIWANHMDSLVPCKKCGRRFFPDRIERHENCCNNVPVSVKYKH